MCLRGHTYRELNKTNRAPSLGATIWKWLCKEVADETLALCPEHPNKRRLHSAQPAAGGNILLVVSG